MVFVLRLEEEISIIYHFCINIKFVHEVSCILHNLLTNLLFHAVVIKLARTHRFVHHLEHVDTCVTFDRVGRELTLSGCIYGTTKCWFACTRESHKDWSCECYLVNFGYLSTLSLSSSKRVKLNARLQSN